MLTIAGICIAVGLIALTGLVTANLLRDRGVPHTLSRLAGSLSGGVAFLFEVLWLEAPVAIALAGACTLTLLFVRLYFGHGLRGVGGSARAHSWAEITYPLAGTVSLAVGWGWLGDKWLAFMPIAFMAWGDSVAGLIRSIGNSALARSIWPSAAMLALSLTVAALYQPYWLGALGALTASIAERFSPATRGLWDDNWVVVAVSLSVMAILTKLSV